MTKGRKMDAIPDRPLRWSVRKFDALWSALKEREELDLVRWAAAVEVKSLSTLYAWRRGDSKPDVDQMFALAHAMGVDWTELVE